jgi:uncharacterized protein
MKSEKDVTEAVTAFVTEAMRGHDSGHGWSHIERVLRLALHIHACEVMGNRFIIELGALMHDVGDHKFKTHDGPAEIRRVLGNLEVDSAVINAVVKINEEISFSKGKRPADNCVELQIVQDADRLDAMGAIGIARAFNYGGFRGNEIYDPRERASDPPLLAASGTRASSTIGHFYEKLLLLRNLMNTETGRKLAEERHDFMLRYLDQFHREWDEGVRG